MDPFVALLLLPPVIAGSVLAYAAVKQRWAVHEIITRMQTAEREASASRMLLSEQMAKLERFVADHDAFRTSVLALEQQVASLKNQFSLSSTARR